jgi:hypothetical protein
MPGRRFLVGGVVLLALVVAVVALPRLNRKTNPPPVSHERYERIREGMTVEEVEAVIGVPPGNYETRRHRRITYAFPWSDSIWRGDEGAIAVRFDGSGRVKWHTFIDISEYTVDDDPNFVEKLREWLGL